MRIIDVTYPFLVLLVINLYQKVQHHDTVIAKIDTKFDVESHWQQETSDSEILNNESDYKKDEDPHQDTMKENLVHNDETKRDKSLNMNRNVSRKASHSNYDKRRNGRVVSMIPTYEYRKSFDATHGIRSKKKKAMKEIWAKHQSFPQDSRKAIESAAGNNLMMFKDKQKQNVQKKDKKHRRNVESRKLINNTSDVIHKDENDLYQTSCVLTKAEIIYSCDDYDYDFCSDSESNDRCTDTSIVPFGSFTWQELMLYICPKTCNACLAPVPLLDNQVQHEEDGITVTTFNLSLNVNTDEYANETSWTFMSQDRNDSIIVNSNEMNLTFKLENITGYGFSYNCIISQNEERENEFSENKTKSTCYHFEVHDSFGDGICCEYGDGSFSININTNSTALKIGDKFEDGLLMSSSFCINHDDGEIESEGKFITTEQPTQYPFKRWQCKNQPCLCDSKPILSSNIHENHVFLFQVTMISDSYKLQDVESAQYKAACWVLYDDPFEYDLVDVRKHKRMIQRYILAVFYFATSPEKWEEHSDFLSSRSECDWDIYYSYKTDGISCDEDDNVISIDLWRNNLDGTIADEIFGLRMLEELDLYGNNIDGTIPPVLGQLPVLRHLGLGGNNLEGTIPPQLFNATNLEVLELFRNRLEGTISETIANLQKLSELGLSSNNLSGSIPDGIYTLKNLKDLSLWYNKLSSSISPLIGNLNKLELLWLNDNMLTGQIPSTIGSLSSLLWLDLENNRLSGPIPSTMGNLISLEGLGLNNNTLSGPISESLFDLPLRSLNLQDNSVTGSFPDEFCERLDDDYFDFVFFEADCQNDVFKPEVSCSCCKCKDESPIWEGDCADATIKVVMDHDIEMSWGLNWSLTNSGTGKKIIYDGPYSGDGGLQKYEACVAYSDCFLFNQISPPSVYTNYQIYWNNNSIHNSTFQGNSVNNDVKEDDTLQTLLSLQFDEENQKVTSCYDVKLECYEEELPLFLKPNTTQRIMYDQAVKISGRSTIRDKSSLQSKALCWMLNNNHHINNTEFEQRYILAILHFMSSHRLFGDDEYPPNTHECNWNGITCRDNIKKIVTEISLSSEKNQIINGTLIDEIGSLKYLKVLELNHTKLHGTIPQSFSNLWSLMKLDLSGNKISSTLPATLFRQLNKLEYINLSNCQLSGSINDDIGSFSRISTLLLRDNLLTGSLPLESFKHYDLEHLDTSENKLNQIDFSPLLKHKNLKYFDISSNFLVGSLPDHTFTSLTQLKYFNASQNDIAGTIPLSFPELSNITHIDLHANKLRGPIPSGITELQKIQHLNLQGNKLTGSLSSEINQLQSLTTLVLSHNELKGSIPFNQSKLQKIERLHLQNNKLEGVAPIFNKINSYITDCGFPTDSLDPVTCSTCNTCCNSDGGCQSKTSEKLSQVDLTVIFVLSIIGLISICYLMKDYITSNKYLESFFSETVFFWNAMILISDKSVYHFLLAKNKAEWFVALCCVVFQTATLFLFVHSADLANKISDREYTMTCPSNSLECDNSNTVSSYGLFVFGLILTIWLLKDIIGSIKLMLVSFQKRSIDFFFASAVIFTVTMLSIWTSIIYIDAIATKNTDMIKDAVVLLFVVEIDERIFQLVESINPGWIQAIDNNMRGSLIYGGDDLVIISWATKSGKSMESMRDAIRGRYESFRERNSKGSGKGEMNEEREEDEELRKTRPI